MDGIETARATSIARLMSSRVTSRWCAGDRDLARRVEALDVLAADADEGAVDLPARQALGLLDRVRDRADGLVDVDDDALLEPGRRDGPVAHDRQPAVAAHLADEGADLARADVDADEDRFSFHRVVRLRCRSPAYRKWRRMSATLLKMRSPKVMSATR